MSLEQESHPKNVLIQNKLVPKGILFLLHLLEFLTLNHFQKETIKYYYSNIGITKDNQAMEKSKNYRFNNLQITRLISWTNSLYE